MKVDWCFSENDIEAVRSIVTEQQNNAFVVARERRNLVQQRPDIGRAEFWKELVACLLTSVQRSGPESSVSRFLRVSPFPLGLSVCLEQSDLLGYAQRAMQNHGGIRFTTKIPLALESNIIYLREDRWHEIDSQLQQLRTIDSVANERTVCRDLIHRFREVGPKQSRNLLQGLGVAKYEIPLDSRICAWLERNSFPIPLTSQLLGDENYYEFALDGLQALCRQAEVLPCIFDAAVFSSFDGDGWTDDNVIY